MSNLNLLKDHSKFVSFRYLNRYQLLLSEMYLESGDFARAIREGREARVLAQSKGVRKNIAKSYWLEGQCADRFKQYREAVEPLKKAVDLADEIQHGSLRWKTRLSLAEALVMGGESAAEVIQQVHGQIEQMIHSLEKIAAAGAILTSIESCRRLV